MPGQPGSVQKEDQDRKGEGALHEFWSVTPL